MPTSAGRIELVRLLDDGVEAALRRDWTKVHTLARRVLLLEPTSPVGQALARASERHGASRGLDAPALLLTGSPKEQVDGIEEASLALATDEEIDDLD